VQKGKGFGESEKRFFPRREKKIFSGSSQKRGRRASSFKKGGKKKGGSSSAKGKKKEKGEPSRPLKSRIGAPMLQKKGRKKEKKTMQERGAGPPPEKKKNPALRKGNPPSKPGEKEEYVFLCKGRVLSLREEKVIPPQREKKRGPSPIGGRTLKTSKEKGGGRRELKNPSMARRVLGKRGGSFSPWKEEGGGCEYTFPHEKKGGPRGGKAF